MSEELMTAAVCWEMNASVSVSFAHTAKDLFYFCPDPCCLVEVVPAKKVNYFFRAPQSHVPGCVNEKKKTTESPLPRMAQSRPLSLPPQIIPSHLGVLPKRRKSIRPSREEMHSLAMQVRSTPVLYPGTLHEVIDAWNSMNTTERHQQSLQIAGHARTYFDAFVPFSGAKGQLAALKYDHLIAFGLASVSYYLDSFYVATLSRFDVDNEFVPIRVRVRPDDPDYKKLKHGQKVMLFLHGTVTAISRQGKYVEVQRGDEYSGFIIKPASIP